MTSFLIRAGQQGGKSAEQWANIRDEAERHFAEPGADDLVIDIVGFVRPSEIVRVTFSHLIQDSAKPTCL